jgi:hypothetical protein
MILSLIVIITSLVVLADLLFSGEREVIQEALTPVIQGVP